MQGHDKVETAIKRLQTFEPRDGYYLAFSGGKDKDVTMKSKETSNEFLLNSSKFFSTLLGSSQEVE